VLADLFRPIVETLRPIPPIAWTPIAILWFGIGDAPSYFLVFIGAIFRYSSIPSHVLRDVVVPSALPLIFPGLRIGLGVGWMCVVAAELIAAQSGLGYMIQQSRMLLQTQNVVTGMLTIGIGGLLMSARMTWIERRLIPWRAA
jgi:NitT/TauT family transport system permease protein